jgi:hypothetical protein
VQVDDVKTMTPLNRLLYWISERHAIYLRRAAGQSRPWTDDRILRDYFFTNPFRELDKTTLWFKEMVRGPLACDPAVLMATVIFRWFNYIPTGELLLQHGLLHEWDEKGASQLLVERWHNGEDQVFTGAFMIKAGNGPRGCKIPSVCRAISAVQRGHRDVLAACGCPKPTLRGVWEALRRFPYLGGFMAYEIVCDLRWTALLSDATDTLSWCNPGPGAVRGLNRLLGRRLDGPFSQEMWQENTRRLLERVRGLKLKRPPHSPEMREVEMSLCEYDKYERGLWGGPGRLKRRYNGG